MSYASSTTVKSDCVNCELLAEWAECSTYDEQLGHTDNVNECANLCESTYGC